jgi:hypothetical protein
MEAASCATWLVNMCHALCERSCMKTAASSVASGGSLASATLSLQSIPLTVSFPPVQENA